VSSEISEPAASRATPGDLDLAIAFVNTIELDIPREELGTPEALREWLIGKGVKADRPLDEDDLERAVTFREALRKLLLANNGQPLDRPTLKALREAAGESPLQVEIGPAGQAELAPACTGVEHLIARLLAAVAEAQAEGSWERLKACAADDCQWAFYDQSRNRSRTWCSMEVCGNRSKTRSYRARKGKRRT
jgi:predicted RNA-binding Zn ribbon-like protein